jgi:uncharacterized peroxidase-related enzyme
MRLEILDRGHALGTKILFGVIRAASRQPVLDIIKLMKYRPDFLGTPMGVVTQEAMRGPSAWSVGDRELMAAVVAQANTCAFCTQAHSAVARGAYRDDATVAAVLADLDSAQGDPRLLATLRLLRKLAREHTLSASDMRSVLNAGVTRAQIEDALAVAFAFNVTARLAEAFGFTVPGADAMNAGAKYLLARGYR